MTTPPLPDWIRQAEVPGYTTAHRICTDETRLYGTESLYGDWNGAVLLLAKDFAPSRILHERIANRMTRPYSHDKNMRANVRLRLLAKPHEPLGLLYGSALANLLRDDDRVSGALPNRKEALAHGAKVLKFALMNMPSLRWIMCLGHDAWVCACDATGVQGDWATHRKSCKPLGKLIAAFHPSARVAFERIERNWKLIRSRR